MPKFSACRSPWIQTRPVRSSAHGSRAFGQVVVEEAGRAAVERERVGGHLPVLAAERRRVGLHEWRERLLQHVDHELLTFGGGCHSATLAAGTIAETCFPSDPVEVSRAHPPVVRRLSLPALGVLLAALVLAGCGGKEPGTTADRARPRDAARAGRLPGARPPGRRWVERRDQAGRLLGGAHGGDVRDRHLPFDSWRPPHVRRRGARPFVFKHLRQGLPHVPRRRRVGDHALAAELGLVPALGARVEEQGTLVPLRRGRRRRSAPRRTGPLPRTAQGLHGREARRGLDALRARAATWPGRRRCRAPRSTTGGRSPRSSSASPTDAYPGDRIAQIRSQQFCSDSVGAWLNYPATNYDYGVTVFHEAEWKAGNRRSICWARTDA